MFKSIVPDPLSNCRSLTVEIVILIPPKSKYHLRPKKKVEFRNEAYAHDHFFLHLFSVSVSTCKSLEIEQRPGSSAELSKLNLRGGGVATQKNRKNPKKTSPKFEICGSVRFFRFFSVFFGFFGIFRLFSVFLGFLWYFFGFFRSELRQEIPVIQKSCQQ